MGPLGRAYALSGRRNDARRILDELLNRSRNSYPQTIPVAMIYTALGDKNEALHWLEEGYRAHDGNMILLKVLPAWDVLRPEPRFQDLLRRIKFP